MTFGIVSGAISAKEFRSRVENARTRLFRTAYSWTHRGDLAEDLAQETIVKALGRANQLRDPDALEAWLFKIMANLWRDYVRKDSFMESTDDLDLKTEESPEVLSSRFEVITQVRQAVGALPENYRQTITLVDLEGFSYSETADILQVPVGTIMSRLSRARKQLKKHLTILNSQRPAVSQIRSIK